LFVLARTVLCEAGSEVFVVLACAVLTQYRYSSVTDGHTHTGDSAIV